MATTHTGYPIALPTRRSRRTAESVWLERTNPLAGLSVSAARRIYDAARGGDFSRIQYLYAEIEREDPVLMTCVDRRCSAVSGLGWKVSTLRDGAEADEQRQALSEALEQAEGLDEALEHLALAFFRGFAHARPVWDGPGRLAEFDLLNNWNFARDPATGVWFWNPRAEYCDPAHPGAGLEPVPEGELVTVRRTREIDRPALALCLRDAVGEREWGRFLERYGVPFVVFTAPPNTSNDTMPRFAEAAEKISDGLSTAVPAGSNVSFAGEARGSDPFTPFSDHVHKLIVLMSTGGTLTSLAEAGSGTLAGNAQMEVWQQIVKRDGVAIGAAVDRSVCRPLLAGMRDFAGRRPLVRFELGGDRQLEPGEIFDVAAKARSAGYRIAKDELEKATGYTLEEEPHGPASGYEGGFGGAGFPQNLRNARSVIETPLQNARRGPDVEIPPPAPRDALEGILEAFSKDMGPAADEFKKLLDTPDDGLTAAAAALAERLPDLMPGDPEMAAVLEEEMARAFAEEVASGAEAVENRQGEKCPDCGQWLDANGVCHECRASDEAAACGENPDKAEVQAAEIGKGKAAIRKCLGEKTDVYDAVTRSDIGSISFIFGSPVDTEAGKAYGLAHLFEKHRGEGIVENLHTAIVRGKVRNPGSSGNKIAIDYDGYQIHLAKTFSRKGSPTQDRVTWIITGFKTEKGDAD